MSQSHVERVIGLLVTDEALRSSFRKDPVATLQVLAQQGVELTDSERWALTGIDARQLTRFAGSISTRLQRADLKGGIS